MKTLVGRDPIHATKPSYNVFERWALSLINDPRDLVFVKDSFKLLAIFLTTAVYLSIPGNFSWYIAGPYLALNLLVLMPPFVLMLHNTSHRSLYKSKYKYLNYIIPWIISPLMGQSPQTYYAHHVNMHHPENNMYGDKSSTLKYQRDSFFHFARYTLRFIFLGLAEVAYYLWSKRRYKAFKKILAGELIFVAVCILFYSWNAPAALTVLIIPYTVSRFAMMMGNWIQHAFVDSDEPNNCYKNSITCIDTTYNRRCFNDGYHIGHHLKASRHWSEMPIDFLNDKDNYIKNKSMIFRGLDYFMIWILLMTKQHRFLAKYYVDLTGKMTVDEIVTLMKSRLKPVVQKQEVSSSFKCAA